jgi:hypothetical protein
MATDRSIAPSTATGSTAGATPSTAPAARDEEMQRLKDELSKANAELERIRKRLSQPNP